MAQINNLAGYPVVDMVVVIVSLLLAHLSFITSSSKILPPTESRKLLALIKCKKLNLIPKSSRFHKFSMSSEPVYFWGKEEFSEAELDLVREEWRAVQMRTIIGGGNGGTNLGHLFQFAADQFSDAGALLSAQHILWNPSVGRKLTLPDCPHRCYSGMEIGFGFNPITDDYKIVIISNPHINGGTIESSFVYAMKTHAWCAIAPPTFLYTEVASNGCFVNGCLHWVVQRYNGDPNEEGRRYILTFDISTHVYGMMVLPQFRWTTRQLTTIKGYSVYKYSTTIATKRNH
ncbi:hypothetical protein LXL04_002688 [Taraxacum kok-saghyz]